MPTRPMTILAAMTLALALAGCHGGGGEPAPHADPPPPPPPAPLFRTAVEVTDVDGVRSDAFWLGDHVRIWLAITNLTGDRQVIHFPSLPCFEYGVDRSGVRVWRWTDDQPSAPIGFDVVMGPYETVRYFVDWDQRDSIGVPVGPGSYDIDAWIPTLDGSDLIDALPALRIDLVAPPAG